MGGARRLPVFEACGASCLPPVRAAVAPGPGRGGGGPATAAKNLTLHVLLRLPARSAAPRLGCGYCLQHFARPASQDVLPTHPGPDEAGEYNPSPGDRIGFLKMSRGTGGLLSETRE